MCCPKRCQLQAIRMSAAAGRKTVRSRSLLSRHVGFTRFSATEHFGRLGMCISVKVTGGIGTNRPAVSVKVTTRFG